MTAMCIAAANYLIERTNEYNNAEGRSYGEKILLTCKRLQKLLYFSEIFYMKLNNGAPMLEDDFCAWPSGPVIPSVYGKFEHFQSGEMIPVYGERTALTDCMKAAIDIVFKKTVKIDTYDLVEKSHVAGGPWACAYDPSDDRHIQIISKEDMYAFYKDKDIETFFDAA